MTPISKPVRINERIRIREVRVIGQDGAQLGIMPIQEALQKAYGLQLDLVEVAPEAKPPVCRIMDYGKYRYEQSKKAREAKKKQTVIQIKEIKLRPKTEEHDFQFKLRHAERFLEEGNKTKVTMMFRGREVVHMQRGKAVLDRFAQALQAMAAIEQVAKLEGRNMVMILAPKPGVHRTPPKSEAPKAEPAKAEAPKAEAPNAETPPPEVAKSEVAAAKREAAVAPEAS